MHLSGYDKVKYAKMVKYLGNGVANLKLEGGYEKLCNEVNSLGEYLISSEENLRCNFVRQHVTSLSSTCT
jgi:hypothetical protein